MKERDNGDKEIYWVMLEDKELSEWGKEYEREVTRRDSYVKQKEKRKI